MSITLEVIRAFRDTIAASVLNQDVLKEEACRADPRNSRLVADYRRVIDTQEYSLERAQEEFDALNEVLAALAEQDANEGVVQLKDAEMAIHHSLNIGAICSALAVCYYEGRELTKRLNLPHRTTMVSDAEVIAADEDPSLPTRADQAAFLGISERTISGRLKKIREAPQDSS